MRLSVVLWGTLAAACGVHASPRAVAQYFVASARANPQTEFENWMQEHRKQYTTDELSRRFEIWQDNVEYVHEYNTKHTTHWLELGPHADLTQEEYAQQLLGYSGAPLAAPSPFPYADVDSKDLPDEIDWRKEGAVTHVKNQKQCGSCWAFSTTGAIEGINAIFTGTLEVLSEQELIDCDTKHDHGCNGGLMDTAFEWVVKNGGIDTENDYKYHAVEGICSVNRRKREVVTIDSYADVPSEDEHELKKAVAHQPVAIAVQANQRAFQLYGGGVFTGDCGTQLDHGVLVAGYGRENGTDFWLVKNSWGPAWGDHGYIKLERSEHGQGPGKCGVAVQPSIPIKKHDNPPRPPKPAPDPPAPAPAPSPAPGPSPEPVQCDAQSECFPGTTCCCQQMFLQVCVQWACCPIPEATCCDDHIHCCPKQLPVCDVAEGRCLPKGPFSRTSAHLGVAQSAPMVSKVPALPRSDAQLRVDDST